MTRPVHIIANELSKKRQSGTVFILFLPFDR